MLILTVAAIYIVAIVLIVLIFGGLLTGAAWLLWGIMLAWEKIYEFIEDSVSSPLSIIVFVALIIIICFSAALPFVFSQFDYCETENNDTTAVCVWLNNYSYVEK